MNYRELGRTGIEISEIGFGAWGIGGRTPGATSYGDTDDRVSRQALEEAFRLGITFYDTANVYGNGHSETLIGETFSRGRRGGVVISTKAGCLDFNRPLDFSPDSIAKSVDESLKRLRTDYIDVLMLHDPLPDEAGLDDTIALLDRLKERGKVRALGASLRAPDDIPAFVDHYGLDVYQVNLNLMDQRLVYSGALDVVRDVGAAIIARTPLCFGFLSERLRGDISFHDGDHRNRWPAAQARVWQEGGRQFSSLLAEGGGKSLAQAALRFCLSWQGVASVIPGIMTPEEARENAYASDLGVLSNAEMDAVKTLYLSRDFFAQRPQEKLAMAEK